MASEDTDEYNTIHSYFIGPKGSNMPDFRANVNTVLDELLEARLNYWPEDKGFITTKVRRSKKFREVSDNLANAVRKVAQLLGEHSAPFWSPRYEAHMCMDLTMPSLLGYFMTMLYNPNNVALEASPLTTLAELRTGLQLCDLFGYNHDPEKEGPVGWGHITCDGTVANLESIWVARNLKFYPIALFRAVTEGKLKFVAPHFKVALCQKGTEEKLFSELEPWELINLRPETVLDLQDRLSEQFGISGKFLQDALEDYNIQTVGRGPLENAIGLENPMKYFVAKTRHYSWPKAAAIAGIGSSNMVGIEVDHDAHINIELLREKLQECVDSKTAVYAVVAIIGSTEEGAVDNLTEILALRQEFQDKYGLSFLVHADAAWGGYFATMLHRGADGAPVSLEPALPNPSKRLIPALTLRQKTEEDLLALRHADSITVDPHKAGYIPYPAGSLVYKDGRMRHLVTWSGPYLSQGSAENIGVYGVEGSKPGASAMSTWFSNQTIGLNPDGYGLLLGEAAFTSGRLSAHYASIMNDDFIFVPFNALPSEKGDPKAFLTSPEVEQERQWIRDNIIGKDNKDLIASEAAMKKLRELGSDLNINAFAINWKDENGNLNKDLEEANYLMKRVVDKLSITTANTDPTQISMFLTSTRFEPEDYGECALHFMERMGLDKCEQGLFVIRNVVMSPFPTEMNFIDNLMTGLKDVIKKEVDVCRERNRRGKRFVKFLVQGTPSGLTTDVFLVLQTSFHSATLRQQLIFSAKLDKDLTAFYKSLTENSEAKIVMLESVEPLDIETVDDDIRDKGPVGVQVKIYAKDDGENSQIGTMTLTSVVVSRPLNSVNRDSDYPAEFMPFYLYGTEQGLHISHMLVRSPNIALSASNVKFSPDLPQAVCSPINPTGFILGLSEVPEVSMQPFPTENSLLPNPFFFRAGKTFQVKVWKDPYGPWSAGPGLLNGLGTPLYTGTMTLGEHVAVDAKEPNKDLFSPDPPDIPSWQKQLDEIGAVLNGSYVEKDE